MGIDHRYPICSQLAITGWNEVMHRVGEVCVGARNCVIIAEVLPLESAFVWDAIHSGLFGFSEGGFEVKFNERK